MKNLIFVFLFVGPWVWGQSLNPLLKVHPTVSPSLNLKIEIPLTSAQKQILTQESEQNWLKRFKELPVEKWPESKIKLFQSKEGGVNGGGGDDVCAEMSDLYYFMSLALWESKNDLVQVPLSVRNLLKPIYFRMISQMQCLPSESETVVKSDENLYFLGREIWKDMSLQKKSLLAFSIVLDRLNVKNRSQEQIESLYDELIFHEHQLAELPVSLGVTRHSNRVIYYEPSLYFGHRYPLGSKGATQVDENFCRWLGHSGEVESVWADFNSQTDPLIAVSAQMQLQLMWPSLDSSENANQRLKTVTCWR